MEKEFDLKNISGLSQAEAERIIKTEGYNELPSQRKRGAFSILLKVLSEPMLFLLAAGGAVYFFLGEMKDALMLLSCAFLVIGITFYKEHKTERTLEALKKLSSPKAMVIRSGEKKMIFSKEIVRGDIIIVREGDRIPADATVLSCENLSVDESLLTGESLSVRKISWDGRLEKSRPGGNDLPFVYSGSMVVSGRGIAKVNATGARTEIGKIGKSLETIKEEDTLLRKETTKIVRFMAAIGLFLCTIVVLVYAFIKESVIQGFLAGITLSMALLPEEFPVILIIFLTLGAWRISKRKVLTRRSAVIETLGAATVLCVDKTGTLTLNKMELTSLYSQGSFYEVSDFASTPLPEKFHNLLEYGILASQKDLFDPMEKELYKTGELYLRDTNYLHKDWTLEKEYHLSRELLALSHAWRSPSKKDFVIASKGSPEAILHLCHAERDKKEEIMKKVGEMSEKGLRVLGVAKAVFSENSLPKSQHEFVFEFVGLLGFIDPLRSTVAGSVKEAYTAGMRVIMITGDFPGTACSVAKKAGIKNPESYIIGKDLEKMSPLELREKIKVINIFARFFPEQKLLLVNALKANNEIVAMTGDGVNDAPALKDAHIGIAMGQRGTDVAREAASLVLLNDDFSSIIAAVRLGRRIFDNLKRAMGYALTAHIPIAGMALLPLAFDFPVVLLPAHIAFLEFIIDPACSVVFEAEKEGEEIMKRPPRNIRHSVFNRKTVSISLLQGLSVLLAIFMLFVYAIKSGRVEEEARSFAFASLVLANLMLIIVNLSWSKSFHKIVVSANKTFFFVFFGAIFFLLAALYIPVVSGLFRLAPLGFNDLALISFVMFLSLIWFEILKIFRKDLVL
jgi:Ca2+-transporting ATPase